MILLIISETNTQKVKTQESGYPLQNQLLISMKVDLRGGFCGPWSHWVCLECANWLDQIELHNLDEDEGPK